MFYYVKTLNKRKVLVADIPVQLNKKPLMNLKKIIVLGLLILTLREGMYYNYMSIISKNKLKISK